MGLANFSLPLYRDNDNNVQFKEIEIFTNFRKSKLEIILFFFSDTVVKNGVPGFAHEHTCARN